MSGKLNPTNALYIGDTRAFPNAVTERTKAAAALVRDLIGSGWLTRTYRGEELHEFACPAGHWLRVAFEPAHRDAALVKAAFDRLAGGACPECGGVIAARRVAAVGAPSPPAPEPLSADYVVTAWQLEPGITSTPIRTQPEGAKTMVAITAEMILERHTSRPDSVTQAMRDAAARIVAALPHAGRASLHDPIVRYECDGGHHVDLAVPAVAPHPAIKNVCLGGARCPVCSMQMRGPRTLVVAGQLWPADAGDAAGATPRDALGVPAPGSAPPAFDGAEVARKLADLRDSHGRITANAVARARELVELREHVAKSEAAAGARDAGVATRLAALEAKAAKLDKDIDDEEKCRLDVDRRANALATDIAGVEAAARARDGDTNGRLGALAAQVAKIATTIATLGASGSRGARPSAATVVPGAEFRAVDTGQRFVAAHPRRGAEHWIELSAHAAVVTGVSPTRREYGDVWITPEGRALEMVADDWREVAGDATDEVLATRLHATPIRHPRARRPDAAGAAVGREFVAEDTGERFVCVRPEERLPKRWLAVGADASVAPATGAATPARRGDVRFVPGGPASVLTADGWVEASHAYIDAQERAGAKTMAEYRNADHMIEMTGLLPERPLPEAAAGRLGEACVFVDSASGTRWLTARRVAGGVYEWMPIARGVRVMRAGDTGATIEPDGTVCVYSSGLASQRVGGAWRPYAPGAAPGVALRRGTLAERPGATSAWNDAAVGAYECADTGELFAAAVRRPGGDFEWLRVAPGGRVASSDALPESPREGDVAVALADGVARCFEEGGWRDYATEEARGAYADRPSYVDARPGDVYHATDVASGRAVCAKRNGFAALEWLAIDDAARVETGHALAPPALDPYDVTAPSGAVFVAGDGVASVWVLGSGWCDHDAAQAHRRRQRERAPQMTQGPVEPSDARPGDVWRDTSDPSECVMRVRVVGDQWIDLAVPAPAKPAPAPKKPARAPGVPIRVRGPLALMPDAESPDVQVGDKYVDAETGNVYTAQQSENYSTKAAFVSWRCWAEGPASELPDARGLARGFVAYDGRSDFMRETDAAGEPFWLPIVAAGGSWERWGVTAPADDALAQPARVAFEVRTGYGATSTKAEGDMATKTETAAVATTKAGAFAEAAKADVQDAVWRTGGRQIVRLARDPAAATLARHLAPGDDALRGKIAAFLLTPAGTAALTGFLALALSGVARTPVAPQLAQTAEALARELRVQAMADGGDLLAELIMGPLREVMATVLRDTPAALPDVGVRVDAAPAAAAAPEPEVVGVAAVTPGVRGVVR